MSTSRLAIGVAVVAAGCSDHSRIAVPARDDAPREIESSDAATPRTHAVRIDVRIEFWQYSIRPQDRKLYSRAVLRRMPKYLRNRENAMVAERSGQVEIVVPEFTDSPNKPQLAVVPINIGGLETCIAIRDFAWSTPASPGLIAMTFHHRWEFDKREGTNFVDHSYFEDVSFNVPGTTKRQLTSVRWTGSNGDVDADGDFDGMVYQNVSVTPASENAARIVLSDRRALDACIKAAAPRAISSLKDVRTHDR